jgi:branched-subunit amino acid ABC-type transport system permease component
MNLFSQSIVSGLMIGAVYALMGIGLVVVYRTSRVLNLAHGESFAVGGIVAAMATRAGFPLWAAAFLAVGAGAALSLALYQFILRTRTHWSMSSLVLTTLATAFLVRGALLTAVGPDPVSFPSLVSGPPLRLAGGIVPLQGLLLIVVGLVASIVLAVVLNMTFLGKQLLATAENPAATQLLGVNVERARLLSFGMSGALGGLSALLLIPLISVDYQTGLSMTMRGFIAAAISGMSPVYSIVAGLLLGLFEALVGTYLGTLSQDPIMFGVLILIALWQSRKIRFGGVKRA